jgi:heme iron utilization protein
MLQSTIRGLRSLLDGQRVLALAVVADGVPYCGLLPFVPLPAYDGVLIHASRLARHTRGLVAGTRVSALIHVQDAPGQDPLQVQRVTFECSVLPLARDGEDWRAGRDRYLQRFADAAVTFGLGDFTLYRLGFEHGNYVEGFARAIAVPYEDIARLAP